MTTAKYESINVEALEEWLKVLESGDIRQGRGELHTINQNTSSMCCLGVASDKFAAVCDVPVVQVHEYDSYYTVKYDNLTSYAPRKVMDHLGIPDDCLVLKSDNGWSILVTVTAEMQAKLADWSIFPEVGGRIDVAVLNDNGFSFNDISALLRKEFLNA